MQAVFAPSSAGGKLDYVAGWFKKSADFIKETRVEVGFVSSETVSKLKRQG